MIASYIPDSCRVVCEEDPESGQLSLYIRDFTEPPNLISILIGEIVYNLRSCLDQLIYHLILANGNVPGRSEFPIFLNAADFPGPSHQKIRGLTVDQLDRIKLVQPYLARDPVRHPLAILHELNNMDKHRVIAICAVGVTQNDLTINMVDEDVVISDLPTVVTLKDGAKIVSVVKPIAPGDFKLYAELEGEIRFGPGTHAEGLSVQEALHILLIYLKRHIFASPGLLDVFG